MRAIRDEFGPEFLADAMAQDGLPQERDMGLCVVLIVAYAINGSHIFLMRLDQPTAGPFFTRQQAILVGQAITEHTGQEILPVYLWQGQALPYDSYAFEFIVPNP